MRTPYTHKFIYVILGWESSQHMECLLHYQTLKNRQSGIQHSCTPDLITTLGENSPLINHWCPYPYTVHVRYDMVYHSMTSGLFWSVFVVFPACVCRSCAVCVDCNLISSDIQSCGPKPTVTDNMLRSTS